MSQWHTGILLTLSGLIISLIFSYLAHKRNSKNDAQIESESRGVLQSDVGYIKAGVDDLKRENRAVNLRLDSVCERVTRVEESCKQAHKRIDEERRNIHENT